MSLGNDDIIAHARAVTTSGLSAAGLLCSLLEETPLFYVALASGTSFVACVTSACPSCVVALVAVTSFVSFALDSARRYVTSLSARAKRQ